MSGERDVTVTASFEATQVSCGSPKVKNVIFWHSFLVPRSPPPLPSPPRSSRTAMTAPTQCLLSQQSVDQARNTELSPFHLLNKARVLPVSDSYMTHTPNSLSELVVYRGKGKTEELTSAVEGVAGVASISRSVT